MGKKPVKYCVVDAFTNWPFKENGLGVCLLEEDKGDKWLQVVAAELNQSTTCFLTRIAGPDSDLEVQHSSSIAPNPRFRIRWFTPVAENHCFLHVKLCGHATLAASHCIFTSRLVNACKIENESLSGVLTVKRLAESKEADSTGEMQNGFSIELHFPLVPLTEFNSAEVPSLSEALNGASAIDLKQTTTEKELVAVLPSGRIVAGLQPQFDVVERFAGRGIIVTGLASPGSGFDFFSRFFCPNLGSSRK
ncbi:hypothetical protein NMG60_11034862 [Bertholletia excelsa]